MNTETKKTTKSDIYKIDVRNITTKNDFNSRIDFGDIEELAKQIAKDGVLNPIHVQRVGDDKFELVDGERRYRAVLYNIQKGIDMPNIPCIIVNKNTSEQDLIRMQIQCNEGKNFTEYEYGVAYKKLKDSGLSNQEICELVGKKIWHVNVCLAHLERDERIQQLMKDGRITGSDVRRVYQAHKNPDESVKVILMLDEMAKEKNDERISLTDLKKAESFLKKKNDEDITDDELNLTNKTILVKDTMNIKMALISLANYANKGNVPLEQINALELLEMLKKGILINKAINSLQYTQKAE